MLIIAVSGIFKLGTVHFISCIFSGTCKYELIQIDAARSVPPQDMLSFTQLHIRHLDRM